MCVTWLFHIRDMTHSHMWHDSFTYMTWLIHVPDMTHSYTWHGAFMYVVWLGAWRHGFQRQRYVRLYVWHDSVIHVIWCVYIGDMIQFYVWNDLEKALSWLSASTLYTFTYVTYLNHIRDRICPYMWHDSSMHVHSCMYMHSYMERALLWLLASTEYAFTSETWLNHLRDIIHQSLWRDAIIHVTWLWKGVVVAFSAATTPIQSHVTCMNASCHIHGRILSNIWLSHISYINVHLYVRHDSITIYVTRCMHVYITWRWKGVVVAFSVIGMYVHVCDMAQSYTWHDSFIYVTWHIHVCVTWLAKGVVMAASSMVSISTYLTWNIHWYVTWLIHICNETRPYLWHGSFAHVTWLIHMCHRTHLYVWRDACTYVTWFVCICNMTHPHRQPLWWRHRESA